MGGDEHGPGHERQPVTALTDDAFGSGFGGHDEHRCGDGHDHEGPGDETGPAPGQQQTDGHGGQGDREPDHVLPAR